MSTPILRGRPAGRHVKNTSKSPQPKAKPSNPAKAKSRKRSATPASPANPTAPTPNATAPGRFVPTWAIRAAGFGIDAHILAVIDLQTRLMPLRRSRYHHVDVAGNRWLLTTYEDLG